MNLTDAVNFEYSEKDMMKPLKNITLEEADSTETYEFKPFVYERGAVTKFKKGVINTIRDMQDLPEQVKIFGKRLSFGYGGYFGDTPEETERKKLNLITAERNLNEAQAERYRFTSPKETESLAYGIGGGVVNYGTMLISAGLAGGALKAAKVGAKAIGAGAEAAGLGTMSVMELAGQVQDKTPMKEGEIDIEAMTPEWARKATGGTLAYTAISAVTEKYVGFGQQMRMWSKPIKWGGDITSKALTTLKTAGKNALSEGMTEGIQDLEATGIGLIDGTLEMDKLPARLQQAWKSVIIGGIIGGGVGTAAAMKSARNVKKQLRDMVAPVVGEEEAQTVAEAIYDAGTDNMTQAISIELELSSELKNKHGKVWNSMLSAVSKEMEGKPRFDGWTEDEKAHYANTVAKHFADNALAEANMRGTTLDAILSASDIRYDKGIKIARHINLFDALKNPDMIPAETKLRKKGMHLIQFLRKHGGIIDEKGELKSRDAQKQYVGLINNKSGMTYDDAALLAWQEGYLPNADFNYGRPDINALLDAIDEGLRGNHRYNVVEEETRTFRDMIDDLENELDNMGIDWKNMTAAEIEKAVDEIPEMQSLEREAEFYANYEPEIGMTEDEAEQFAIETEGKEYPLIEDKDLPFYYQLADENAQLDAENPAYEGETININGKERTVYNSNGDRIAKSKEALENFYKWFGDSKVVDEQGRPLVVYHNSGAPREVLSREYARTSIEIQGVFFAPQSDPYQEYGPYEHEVYLRIENPADWKTAYQEHGIKLGEREDSGIKVREWLQNKGYDGVMLYEDGQLYELIAFESNQIKSTSNRGTYSESENIYYQFAGEKAQTAALDELDRAKQLEADGVDNEEIRQQTGWFKGVDGKWRFEISDEDAKMLGTIEELQQKHEDKHEKTLKKLAKLEKEREKLRIAVNKNEITENEYYSKLEENDKKIQTLMDNDEGFRIRDIMKHDKLYEAYPFIANINVFISERIDPDEAYYNRKSQSITVGTNVAKEPASSINLKGIILHEIQHAIQATERFARGGSPDEFESMEQLRKGLQQAKELLSEANEAIEQAEDLGYSDDTEINGKSVSFYKEQKADAQKQIDYANEKILNYKDPYQKYKSLYGEIEARNTAIRSEFTEELRGKISPERTQDVKNADAIVVFDDGTAMAYEPETYYQSAFAGSPVDYDTPSLEAIGSGEGNQAHGWGLYYALNRAVAEGYRKRSTESRIYFRGKQLINSDSGNPASDYWAYYTVATKGLQGAKDWYNEAIEIYENSLKEWPDNREYTLKEIKQYKEGLEKIEALTKKDIEELTKKGQVHEVDIPENPYLLDEQKSYREQSDYVKEALIKIDNELQNAKRKEKIFDKKEDAIDFYDSKIDEFEEKANGYQRFLPESFVTDDGKFGVRYADDYTIYEPLIGEDLGITGEGIYSAIARRLGSQKEASLLLEKYGIKGITYYGRQDGRCFVIFNPKDVKVIQKFYQRGKNAKGYTNITPDEYIIKLLEDADESTLPHEFAHYWLTEMWNYTRTGRASENYMKRWQIISDYLGVTPEQTRLTREQQEKFASSYEAYLTRGELPTPLIGSVFDDYDKWLQRVYSDYNKINYQSGKGKRRVRLTDAAIKFFQSMTTGTLEPPALAPKDTGVTIPEKVETVAETVPVETVEAPTVSDTTIVTNGDKGVSKVYKREASLHPEAVSMPGLAYDKMHLDEQAREAKEFVEKDLNKAREFIGEGKNETGRLTRTAVMQAYEKEMLRIGNLDEYDRVLQIHSWEQSRRGQEVVAERIMTDDVTNPSYWLEKAEKNLATKVANKLFTGDNKVKQLESTIKKETEKLYEEIKGKSAEEQQKIINDTAKRIKKEYNLDTFYQMPDGDSEVELNTFIKELFGVRLDRETRNDVINKSIQTKNLWENTVSQGGNPSVEAMRAKRELNDLIQAQTPSNALAIWTSIFGRGIMLTSVKSPVLNIISNIEAGFTEGITRRLMYGTTEKAVDKSVKNEFSKYAWEVYKASSDIVTTMNDYDDDMRIIGEQILHSQGQGAFRAASRKVEEISFKYLMGAPDVIAKTYAFNDTADLLATKIAREEGAKDISARATEIYKDAILIKPVTEQGQLVRKQAQEQAHYTTFTNDSWAAKFGLSARNWLNMVGRNKVRLGDLTMKFVKTPANVQMMGLEYGFGLLYTAYHVQDIIKNPQSETSKIAIRAAVRNGLGIALAALLYSMLDPDDYFSEFDTLNPREKDRMRAMGAMPNSIKIGNRWVSLDYFGQLGIPLVGMLEAHKNKGLRSYVQSGLTQAAKIPGIKETKQLIDSMSEYARYDLKPEKIAQMMAGTVLDQARAMTIPAIVNDIAKMTDDYERDTMGGVMDKVIASIPGLRKTLPERYGIQGLIRTEPGLSTLFFGSRVKTAQEDKLVREVNKLSKKDEQPSISDVTKYGDLRLLSPEKKVKVRQEFYKLYNKESKKLISTREYQKKTDAEKKKALNKVRSRVVKSLKEKYSNDIQREKRRR